MQPLPEGAIAVANVRPAAEASRQAGLPADVLDDLGWKAHVLADDDAHVDGTSTYAHLERTRDRLGSDAPFATFMIDAGQRFKLGNLGVVGLACKTAATLGDAMARHARFQHLTNRTARFTTRLRGELLWFEEHRPGPARPGSLWMSAHALLVIANLIREATDGAVEPRQACLRHQAAPPLARALASVLGPVEGNHAQAAIGFSADVLGEPMPHADPELHAYFDRVLSRGAAIPPHASDFQASVIREIQASLARGDARITEVARRLGMSSRTLQRRLAETSTRFQGLVGETRRAAALGYLADPDLSLGEVAYLLGYQDQASFWRAFRRWEGCTPAQWRRSRW